MNVAYSTSMPLIPANATFLLVEKTISKFKVYGKESSENLWKGFREREGFGLLTHFNLMLGPSDNTKGRRK